MNRFRLVFSTLVLITALTGVAGTVQGAKIQSGMWSGGYGALAGNSPQWHSVIADIEIDGRRIKGKIRLGGKIQGEVKDDVVTLSIQQESRKVDCEARLENGAIIGTCQGDSQPFTLQLVHEQEPSEDTLESMAGLYAAEDGGLIAIRKSIHLVMVDFQTEAYRVLYAEGPDRFTVGERLAVPRPTELQVRFQRDDAGAVTGLTVQGSDGTRQASRCCPYTIEEFTFSNDGVTLAGGLYLPPGPGPHPAAVFVHGSGKQTRAGAGTWPLFLLAKGFAVLAYDKRGQGSSEGRYALPTGGHDNMPHMKRRSTDVLAAVQALKKRQDIDSSQVGLIGGSQAGWVMPMVAESGEVAFTIAISGGATELSIEGRFSNWADENSSGGTPIDEVIARLRVFEATDYDFRPHFAAQKAPGLWLYGAKDRSNPAVLCVELIEEVKEKTGNDFTVHLYPNGNHGLWLASTGGAAETSSLGGLVPGLHETISDWLDAKGFGPRSKSVSVPPEQ